MLRSAVIFILEKGMELGVLFRVFTSALLVFQLSFASLWGASSAKASSGDQNAYASSQAQLIEGLREAILKRKSHPLDPFSLLRQKLYPLQQEASFKDLFLKVDQSPAGSVLNERLNRSNEFFYEFSEEESGSFQIQVQGLTVYDFFFEIKSLVFVDGFLFFQEADSQIYFIDTRFARAGLSELAIFRFPRPLKAVELSLVNSRLKVGEREYSRQEIEDFSLFNQMSFSASVNLLDTERIAAAPYIVDEFFSTFQQNLEASGNSPAITSNNILLDDLQKDLSEQAALTKELEQLKNKDLSEKLQASLDFIHQNKNKLQEINLQKEELEKEQRKLLYRLKRFRLFMSMPRPGGGHLFKENLLRLAVAMEQKNTRDFLEAVYELSGDRRFRYGAAFTGVMLGSLAYPELAANFAMESLKLIAVSADLVMQKTMDVGYLISEAVSKTLRGMNPYVLWDTYVADGRWDKTKVGLFSLIQESFIYIGIAHISVNTFHLVRDLDLLKLKRLGGKSLKGFSSDSVSKFDLFGLQSCLFCQKVFSATENIESFFKNLSSKFVLRQSLDQKKYIDSLRRAEEDRFKLDHIEFSPEDNEEIRRILEKVEEQDFPQTRFASFLQNRKPQFKSNSFFRFAPLRGVKRLSVSLVHFLFSFSSFTKTQEFFIWLKNKIFIASNLVYRPRTWAYLIMYPRFLGVMLSRPMEKARDGKYFVGPHIPNTMNGGLVPGLPIVQSLNNAYSAFRETRLYQNIKKNLREEFSERLGKKLSLPYYWELKNFEQSIQTRQDLEDEVLNLERNLEASVMKESMEALLRYSKSQKDFKILSSGPVTDALDPRLFSLSMKSRMFFSWYRHFAMEAEVARRLVGAVLEKDSIEASIKDFYLEKAKAKDKEELFLLAKERADRSYLSFENQLMNNIYRSAKTFDERVSKQTERFVQVNQSAQKPLAKVRAIRAALASIFVDKPMEVAFTFVMTAAIASPLLTPIHDVQFSENSWNYLSRYQFLNGYLYGLVMSFLSQAWYKLQYDSRLDVQGGFDNVPSGKLAKKSFWGNMLEHMGAPDNTWKSSQRYNIKLVWANMGAAFVTYASSQYYFLGRLDLDLYITGYLVAFLNPLMGFQLKLENAFEKSSGWVIRNIPQKYYTHPEVIRYSMKSLQKLRFRYNIFYSMYENLSYFTINNFRSMSTAELGPRSFSRILLGGFTFTEGIVLSMDSLAEKMSIFKGPAELCRRVFLKNYTDAIKIED